MGILNDAAFRRQFFRNAMRGVVGLSIATPVIAVFQGQYLLAEFRKNHQDAPFPDMPCSGVVVVLPQNDEGARKRQRNIAIPKKRASSTNSNVSPTSASSWFSSFALLREQKDPDPLRLLVVGDSLAAGVGVTKSGTPVLPEAIAKSLSSALGGRAVYWTCMGEPGLSSPQIVKELLLAEEDNSEEDEEREPIDVMDELQDWWHQRRQQQQKRENENNLEEIDDTKENIPESAKKIRSLWRKSKKDFQEIKEKIRWKELGDSVKARIDLSKKMRDPIILPLRRRNTVVPDLVAQYDVAVVITGFNDLKNLIFPLPEDPNESQEQFEKSGKDDGLSSDAWFERDLFSIMSALRSKMRNYKDETQGTSMDSPSLKSEGQCTLDNSVAEQTANKPNAISNDPAMSAPSRRHHPMVVFPAAPLFAEKVYPLSFFADPIIALMESQKKRLAEKYPAPVLFLEGPRNNVISDYLNRRGPLWEATSKEEVLFELTNKARLEHLEKLMKEYYKTWTVDVEEEVPAYSYDVFGPDIQGPLQKIIRSPLISPDNVHPSDEGYELWGRHIADEIIKEWDRDDMQIAAEAGTERCTDHNFDGH